MTKINKEEYWFLNGLNDEWKWIAKDKNTSLWVYEKEPRKYEDCWDDFLDACEKIDSALFQFIQWEDEEPHNIAELIEEYESEETEVNKDIEWLKVEIHKELESWYGVEGGVDGDGINEIMLLINQLDEPETVEETALLLENVLKENKRLGKLLEEKHEEWLNLTDKINNQEVLSQEITEENGMSESEWGEVIDRYKWHLEQEGYVVIEKPTIPQFVAEFLEGREEYMLYEMFDNDFIYDNHDELARWLDNHDELARWLYNNDEDTNKERELSLVLAHICGYKLEEEQKYYLKIGNLYLAEPLGDMTSDIVRMTRDKGVAYQFTDEKSIATHLDKFEGIEAVKVEELEE